MMVLIIVLILLNISAITYIVIQKKQYKNMFIKLNKLFDDAINGDINKVTYDESIVSALNEKIIQYINVNKEFITKVKTEQHNIKSLISDISHQIRTPISNLILYSGLILEKQIPDDSVVKMVIDMQQQSEKLKFLLDILIKTSRLEAGIIAVEPKSQLIKPLISAAVSEIYPAIIKKDIDLSVNINEDLSANFDIKWTKEVVYNILENAVKYTNIGGTIAINAIAYEMFIRIDIADNGIGISSAEYNNIFKRFYRSPTTRKYEGVGIGLYLAREIVTLQGGYITVSSEVDRGSVFSIFLLA